MSGFRIPGHTVTVKTSTIAYEYVSVYMVMWPDMGLTEGGLRSDGPVSLAMPNGFTVHWVAGL